MSSSAAGLGLITESKVMAAFGAIFGLYSAYFVLKKDRDE